MATTQLSGSLELEGDIKNSNYAIDIQFVDNTTVDAV